MHIHYVQTSTSLNYLTIWLFNNSTSHRFNYSNIQLFNYSNIQLFNYSTVQLVNYWTIQLLIYSTIHHYDGFTTFLFLWLTARLKMRMLVVFLIVLLSKTTRTTRRLPTKPITMTKVKRMGTMMGTIVIRVSSCSKSTSSSSTPIVLFIWWTLLFKTSANLSSLKIFWNLDNASKLDYNFRSTERKYFGNFLTKLLPKLAFSDNKPPSNFLSMESIPNASKSWKCSAFLIEWG